MDAVFVDKYLKENNPVPFENIVIPFFHTDHPIIVNRMCLQKIGIQQQNAVSEYHVHSYYELHFVLKGYTVYQFERQRAKTEQGSWFLIPHYLSHRVFEYSSDCFMLTLQFNTQNNNPNYLGLFETIFTSSKTSSGDIRDYHCNLIEDIIRMKDVRSPTSDLRISNDAMNIILDIADMIPQVISPQKSVKKKDSNYLFALQYINDNIRRQLSCREVAESVYLSPRQLNRIFIEKNGMTLSEYIMVKRTDVSKEILQIDNGPLNTIAGELGFCDEFYFSKFFKKRTGFSPSEYREIYRRQHPSSEQISVETHRLGDPKGPPLKA